MFRHGARQPTAIDKETYIDEFGEKWTAPGELTAAGIRMQFLLGLRNRQVYKRFMDKTKIDGSVYIRSSDFNRTIESVQAQMQGFYPAGTGALINNEKTMKLAHPFIDPPKGGWEKVDKKLGRKTTQKRVEVAPIHLWTRDSPFNQIFFNPYYCKPMYGMHKENVAGPIISNFMTKFKEEYGDIMTKMTGKPKEVLDNYWYLFGMFDSFISDIYDGRDMKKAIENGIDLQKFNRTAFEFAQNDILNQFNGDKEEFFARWSMSVLWPEVIQWMENRIAADKAGEEDNYSQYKLPKFAFFSTHDVTVGSGLIVLNRAFGFKKYYTPFASDIFFELHRNKNGEYKVHVKYQSLTLGVVPFAEFKEKLEKQFMTLEEISEKCGFHPDPIFFHTGQTHYGGKH
jgi:hypothetical protein